MSVESAADRAMFLSPDDFGVTVLYQQRLSRHHAINGILDRQHLSVETGDGAVTALSVTFTCRADDLALLPFGKALQGDLLTLGGDRWMVVEPQTDGTGMVVLLLQKDA